VAAAADGVSYPSDRHQRQADDEDDHAGYLFSVWMLEEDCPRSMIERII